MSTSRPRPQRPAAYTSQCQVVLRRGFALTPTLSRLGLGRLPVDSHLPAADAATVRALTSVPRHYRNQQDEISVIPMLFAQAQSLTTLGDRPLAVLTSSVKSADTDGWAGAQEQLATSSTNAVQRTVESTHAGMVEDVGPASEAVRAITEVLASVHTTEPLPSR